MKKISITLLVFFLTNTLVAQKYYTKSGHIKFFSSTPLEDIEANNHQSSSVIDFSKGDIVFSLLMKGFEFEKALMQEHFNEKYVESDEFPKAKFVGRIKDFEKLKMDKEADYKVDIVGKMTIHGVTQEVETEAILKYVEEKWTLQANFTLKPEDYGIKIPALVRDNIAKEVEITVDMLYKEYKKK